MRFRLINRNIVLQSQAANTLKAFLFFSLKLLFMNDATLEQKKMDCYVLVKILKYCTDSHARSYQLKFAVNDVFKNKNIKGMQKA